MTDQEIPRAAVIVTMPADIDLTNQDQAYDQLYAAFASGASVVIADFTGTSFCDCSSMRRLLAVQARAARDAQLRVAITPDGAVRRIVELMQMDRRLAIYPAAQAAIPPPGQDPRETPAGPGRATRQAPHGPRRPSAGSR
jgi:anti-anti-sigma factor